MYTGDLRSEPWFVNSIARNPCLVEYTSGIRTLNKIYLDTSFTDGRGFQTKAQGIAELLRKVAAYPGDTVFHLQAWTFGYAPVHFPSTLDRTSGPDNKPSSYEEVWIALSKALDSKVHVDEYKMRIYNSLSRPHAHGQDNLCPEAPALVGFSVGNTFQPGCLTRDEKARLHSCEKGNYCSSVRDSRVVWVRPVVARLEGGEEISEVGVGGGGDDLEREAELEGLTVEGMDVLMGL